MVVILEGVDRVGKTTIAKDLEEKLGFKIFKKEREGGNNISDNESTLINYGNALGLVDMWNWDGFTDNIVVDRFHWTEAVYSLCDRNNKEPKRLMGFVEHEMLKKKEKYLMVYVRPSDIKFSSRMHGSDLSRHIEQFDMLYGNSSLNKYLTTIWSRDLAVRRVLEVLTNGKK